MEGRACQPLFIIPFFCMKVSSFLANSAFRKDLVDGIPNVLCLYQQEHRGFLPANVLPNSKRVLRFGKKFGAYAAYGAVAACMIQNNHTLFVNEGILEPESSRALAAPPYDHCNFTVRNELPEERTLFFWKCCWRCSFRTLKCGR